MYTPSVSLDRRRQRPDLARRGDHPQPVAQPLDGGSGDEDRRLERVGHRRRRSTRRPSSTSRPPVVGTRRRRSSARSCPCRRCSSPSPRRSRPGRTTPPVGRRRSRPPGCRRAPRTGREVSPNLPLDADTSGSAATGTPSRSHSSSLQRSSVMSNNMVREAFDGSVACTSPPVRFHRIQASIVPSASSSEDGNAAHRQQPLELGAREVGVEHEAGPVADEGKVAGRLQLGAASRPCGGPATRSPGGTARRSPGSRRRPSRAGW